MKQSAKIILVVLAAWGAQTTFADLVVQAGGFNATQGKTQDIAINGLLGDRFTVAQTHGNNFLLGLGYYITAQDTSRIKMLYGLDAFYLAPTHVQGDVLQELYFDNLSYQYSLSNFPVYLAAKTIIKTNDAYNITFDLGIGPNFISTNDFYETSLDGVTQPDTIFAGHTSVDFSATAGVGIQFQHAFGSSLPLEIGYRFFYLGQGHLKTVNHQVQGTLETGNNYANAITISTSF